MKKTWLILRNEYLRHARKKSFLFGILSMPLFIAFIALIGFVSVWLEYNKTPIGYVDSNNVIVDPVQVPVKEKKLLKQATAIPYETEESARSALQNGEIQAYFVLSENYMASGEVAMVSSSDTGSNAESDFGDFLAFNLVKDKPPQVAKRLSEGNDLIIRSQDGTREMAINDWMSIIMPILAGVLFVIAVNTSGNYLLQAVVEEKENRTMEIIVTSVSPGQLMAGKVIGNLLIGLTQLATWILFAVLAIKIFPSIIPIDQMPRIDTSNLALIIATFLPAFVMVAATIGAVGATASEAREAQQITGWFTIPILIPLWFSNTIMMNPNGPISVAMSLIPITAPIALPMRAVFTTIPVWQIVLAISLLYIFAIFALWLSGRIFRLGMLRYGKRVRFREAFAQGGK